MIKIALNDLRMFIGDRKALALTFILPVALTALFAFIYGGMSQTAEERPVSLLVCDLAQTDLSQETVQALDSLKGIILTPYPLDEAKDKVSRGHYPAVLVLHPDAENSGSPAESYALELMYDPARELEMGLIQGALIAPLMSMGADRNIRQTVVNQITTEYGYLEPAHLDQIIAEVSASFEKMKGEISTSMESQIKMTPLVRAEQADWGLIQAVAGTVVMMLLFSVAGMGTGLLLEREEGTLKRLLMSPISPNSILFGKLLSALVVGVSQILVVFVFAWIVFDLDLMINLPAVILMVIATAWACSSFGIFLAAISTSRKQVEMLSTLIILIMSAIGGSMIPLPVMPAIMQDLAVISVNYWSIQGFFDIFWRQLPLVDILPRLLVLTGIGAFLIFLSQLFFRRNLSKLV